MTTMKNNNSKKRPRPRGGCRYEALSAAYAATAAATAVITSTATWGNSPMGIIGQFVHVEAAASSKMATQFHSVRGAASSLSSSTSSMRDAFTVQDFDDDDNRPLPARQMVRNVFALEDLDTVVASDIVEAKTSRAFEEELLRGEHTIDTPTPTPKLSYYFFLPSASPSVTPTLEPSHKPTISSMPTSTPTKEPTIKPTTMQPSISPIQNNVQQPTIEPVPNLGEGLMGQDDNNETAVTSASPTQSPPAFVTAPFPSYTIDLLFEEEDNEEEPTSETSTAAQTANEKLLVNELKNELELALTDYMEQYVQQAFSDDVQVDLNVESLVRRRQRRQRERKRSLEDEQSETINASFSVDGAAIFPASAVGDVLTEDDLSEDVTAVVDDLLGGPSSQIKLVEYLKTHPQSNLLRNIQDASATIVEGQPQDGPGNNGGGNLNNGNTESTTGKGKDPPSIVSIIFGFLLVALAVASLLFYLYIWSKKLRKRAKRKRENQTIIGGSMKKKKSKRGSNPYHSGTAASGTPHADSSKAKPSFMVSPQQISITPIHKRSEDADSSSAEAQSNTDSTSTGEDSFAKELKQAASMDRRVWDNAEEKKSTMSVGGRLLGETNSYSPGRQQKIRQHQAELSNYDSALLPNEEEEEEEGIEILQYSSREESASVYSMGSSRLGSLLSPTGASVGGTGSIGREGIRPPSGTSSGTKYSSFPYGDEESTAVESSGIEVTAGAAVGVGVAGVAGVGLYNSHRKNSKQQQLQEEENRNLVTRDAETNESNSDFTSYNHGWSDSSVGSSNLANHPNRKHPADPAGVRGSAMMPGTDPAGVRGSTMMSGTDAAAALVARQQQNSRSSFMPSTGSNSAAARMSPVIMAPEIISEDESHDSESLLTSEIVREVQLLTKFVKTYQSKRDKQELKKIERQKQRGGIGLSDSMSSSGYDSLSESAKARRLMHGGGSSMSGSGGRTLSPVKETDKKVRLIPRTESTEQSDDENDMFFASSSSGDSSDASVINEDLSTVNSDNSRLGIGPFTIPKFNAFTDAPRVQQQRPRPAFEEKREDYGRTSPAQTRALSASDAQAQPAPSRTRNVPNDQQHQLSASRQNPTIPPASRNKKVPPSMPPSSQHEQRQSQQQLQPQLQQRRQEQVGASGDGRKDLHENNRATRTVKPNQGVAPEEPALKASSTALSAREKLRRRALSKMGIMKKDPTPEATQNVPSKPLPQQQFSRESSNKIDSKPTLVAKQTIASESKPQDNSARRMEGPKKNSKLSALRHSEAILDSTDSEVNFSEVNFPVGASLSPVSSPRVSASQKFRSLASNPARNETNESSSFIKLPPPPSFQERNSPQHSPQNSSLLRRDSNPLPEARRPVPAKSPATISSRRGNLVANPLQRESREPYASRSQPNKTPARNLSSVPQEREDRRPTRNAPPVSSVLPQRQTNSSERKIQSQPPSTNVASQQHRQNQQPQSRASGRNFAPPQQNRQNQQPQSQASGRARMPNQSMNTSQNQANASGPPKKQVKKFTNIVSMFENKPKEAIFPPGEHWQYQH